jgi:hypothetical protein
MATDVKFRIEMARGDSLEKGFVLMIGGEPSTDVFDDVFFTVKKYHTDHDFILQKRMSTGSIIDDTNGHYTLFIEPEDTNELQFGEYDADIEFKREGYKRTFYGKFKLAKEVTHYYNE